MAVIGAIAVSAGALVLAVMFDGYVLMKLWLWFIVPVFSLRPLGLVQAIGIGMVVSLLTHQTRDDDEEERSQSERLFRAASVLFLRPIVLLVAGWVVAWFM